MKTQAQINKYSEAALGVLCAENKYKMAYDIKNAYWNLRSINKDIDKALYNSALSLDDAINAATDFLGDPLKDQKLYQLVFEFMDIERAAMMRDGIILDMDAIFTEAEKRLYS